MNSTTTNVLKMQQIERTSMEWSSLFQEVYADMSALITTLTNSYAHHLRGDVAAAESEAGILLLHTIERFEYQGFEFQAFFSRSLHNKLRDMGRTAKAKKNYNAYGTIGSDVEFLATAPAATFPNTVDLSIEDLYAAYALENPGHGEVLEILVMFSGDYYGKSELTDALAAHYGEPTYTGTIQKRVSRIRESFRNYLAANDFKI